MRSISKQRAVLAAAAVGLLALALLVPQAGAAQKPPSLVSTPQYKAFDSYVKELREMRGEPHSAGEKEGFERQLTRKRGAAANRAKAIFQTAKREARGQTRSRFRAATKKIRRAEAAELTELRAEYAGRLGRAASAYRNQINAIETKYDRRYTSVGQQIRTLRKRKAKAKSLAGKDRIQAQINVLVEQMADSRRQEREATDKARERFLTQKRAIQAAKAADTAEVTEARQSAVDSLRARWNRAFEARLGNLQSRRSNQLANLEKKLETGRAAIASMPHES